MHILFIRLFFFRDITIHPNFNIATFANDFAIIKLATPVTFSDRIAPICLPTASTDYDDVLATLTGWGSDTLLGNNFDILQKARIYLITVCL